MSVPEKSKLAEALEHLTAVAGQAAFKKAVAVVPTEPVLLREFALVGALAMELGLADGTAAAARSVDQFMEDMRYQQAHDYAMSLDPQMCPFCMNPYPVLIIARGGESRVECHHCGAQSDSLRSAPNQQVAVDHIITLLQKWNVLSDAARGLHKTSWLPPLSGWVHTRSGEWEKRTIPDSPLCVGPLGPPKT